MKKIIAIIMLISASTSSMATTAKNTKPNEQPLDKIVAIVNDDVVTKTELNHSLDLIKMQYLQANMETPSTSVLKKQALDQIINKKVQLQLAKQAGIEASNKDLERAISFIAKQNNMDADDLLSRVSQEGMSVNDYKAELREQIVLQKLQEQEIIGKISVSEDEVSEYIRLHTTSSNASKEYRIDDIVVALPESASSDNIADAEKQAKTLVSALKNKQTTALSNNNIQHNDLGWRKLDEIPSLFTEQVASMQKDDVAGPIVAPNGIHVLHLTDVRSDGGTQTAPTQKQAENAVYQHKFAEAVQTWISKQRGQSFIKTTIEA